MDGIGAIIRAFDRYVRRHGPNPLRKKLSRRRVQKGGGGLGLVNSPHGPGSQECFHFRRGWRIENRGWLVSSIFYLRSSILAFPGEVPGEIQE
jgi:hypothetical protein